MGRKERRQQERNDRKLLKQSGLMPAEELKARLLRNGITQEDLKRNYDIGFKDGIHSTWSMTFAACMLALSELYGFGQERCFRVLQKIYYHIQFTLDNAELVQEVYDRTGLEIVLDDDMEPIVKKHQKKKKGERIAHGRLKSKPNG